MDANRVLANELRYRIDAYFNLVCRNVRDSVPKLIATFLVCACQDDLKFTLYDAKNKHDELMSLLSEVIIFLLEKLIEIARINYSRKNNLTKDS